MSCQGCATTVTGALEALPGVSAVHVDLETKLVLVGHTEVRTEPAQLRVAVEDQGYEVAR